LRGTGANQTIDQIKLYGDAVRWFAEVGVPEALPGSVAYWRSAACRAWAATVGSPPGPVHLNLAFRDPLIPVADDAGFPHPLDGRPGQEPWTRTGASPAGMSAEDRRGLRALLAAADRCLVVAGEAPGGSGEARALAASGGWPLLADPLSGARMGATAISAYEAILRHPGFASAMRPDLVVRVGRMGTSKPLASYLGPEVPQVVVDPDGDWADPGRSAQWIIRADPSELPSLVELSGPRGAPQGAGSAQTPWTQRWLEAEAAARPAIDAVLDADDSPSEPRTARDLAAWCPDGATLVAASSMPIRDLESFMRPRSGLRVIANRGASGIDGFVSTTLGAALAGRGRGPTVALAGDLSMLHDQNGLLLARSGSVDAVFVVVNNDGGGIFSFLPQAEFPGDFERLFGTPHGMPFEAVAALYRCGYRRVERAAGLTAAVGEALSAGGVHLVEVPTERTANVALHRRIWQSVGAALGAAGFGATS
jgi:2-succinyl-5-enolpyruvyl-6-hydroxy-3-cyclohexene-1-carboxylate synthase